MDASGCSRMASDGATGCCSPGCFAGTDLAKKAEAVTCAEELVSLLKNGLHWGIAFDRENNILICNEKNLHCLCPDADDFPDGGETESCFCTGALLRRLFEAALKRPVKAEPVTTLRNGGRSCVYRVYLVGLSEHEKDVFDRA